MTANLVHQEKTGAFTIDIAKIKQQNDCKGILYLEVKPLKRIDTLTLNNVDSDFISYENPYVLRCDVPIVSGLLSFKPYGKSPKEMKSVVRLLLVQ